MQDLSLLSVYLLWIPTIYIQGSLHISGLNSLKTMSLKDVSDWSRLLDSSCEIPTDVVFDVREEVKKEDGTAQLVWTENCLSSISDNPSLLK